MVRTGLPAIARSGLVVLLFLLSGGLESVHAQLSMFGGNPTLTVSTGTPGGEPTPVVNTDTWIRYRRQSVVTKITVQTSCPSQNFTLRVVAQSPSRGVAAPEVTLVDGMLAVNFITNIPSSGFTNATATLRYTASATFAQGNSSELGNDVHLVTYTLLAQ